MNDLISLAKGKLNDPIMQEWAIHFYSDLPINAETERNQIETEWFHEFFIAQIIDQGDNSIINHLFRELPPQNFSNLTHLLIKNWGIWSASTAVSAANIVAVNAYDELLQLYKKDLALLLQGQVDPLKFSSIDLLYSETENLNVTEFVTEFTQIVIKLKNDFMQSILFHSILKLSYLLPENILAASIQKIVEIETSEDRRQAHFKSLFMGLFGHNEYLEMVFDREKYDSPIRPSALKSFFVDSAPLEQLDKWLVDLPPYKDILILLEAVCKNSKGCQTILRILQNTKEISDKNQAQLALAACMQGLAKDALDTSPLDSIKTVNLLAIDLEFSRWNDL